MFFRAVREPGTANHDKRSSGDDVGVGVSDGVADGVRVLVAVRDDE